MTELGELLQQARAYKGVSLRDAERATRISRQYLTALEAQDYKQLPPQTYARGIVKNYAQYLGLDPATALALFERGTGGAPEKIEVVSATAPLKSPSHWAPNFAIIAFMVVISAIVFAWMYSAYFQPADAVPTSAIGIATVTPVETSIMSVVPSVDAQGGGAATVTPTPTGTVSPTASPTESPTSEPVQEATTAPETTESTVAEAPDEQPDATEVTTAPSTEGSHAFVIWVTGEDVWVDVTVDGVPVFSDIIEDGGERVYYGETLEVTSGNSSFVHLYIDSVEYSLGESWDATFVWP